MHLSGISDNPKEIDEHPLESLDMVENRWELHLESVVDHWFELVSEVFR